MKLLLGCLLLVSVSAFAIDLKPWLQKAPSAARAGHERTEIAPALFFEVPVSKLDTAEVRLADSPSVLQQQSGAAYYGRGDFTCPAGTKPYLVRAAYMNGGTGSFRLYWEDAALIVPHESLGPHRTQKLSALIACLSQAPASVFSSFTGAL